MQPLSFILGIALGGLAMHVCLALEARARRADYKRVRAQSNKAVGAWLCTVDDYLRVRVGDREPSVAMQNRHAHVHEMMQLKGVLDETKA